MKMYSYLRSVFVMVVLLVPTLQAIDVGNAVSEGIDAMRAGEWQKAQGIFEEVAKEYEVDAKEEFGGKFGVIYYNKGFCELRLAREFQNKGGEENLKKANQFYQMAKKSFAACYTFSSDKLGQNPYQKKALFYQGKAEQALQEYNEAIVSYKKFLEERNPKNKADNFNPGQLNVFMAICYFNASPPDFPEGIKRFEIALKNKQRWKTPDSAILGCLQALVKAVIATENEQALIDFLNQNRAELIMKPYQMVQSSELMQGLAMQLLKAKMPKASFKLFELVPDTQIALDDLYQAKEQFRLYPRLKIKEGNTVLLKEQIDERYKGLKAKDKIGEAPEVLKLMALANTHLKNGYTRGAYNIYVQLENQYKKSKHRKTNLLTLVKTAANLSENDAVKKYGDLFVSEYGADEASKDLLDVQKVLLSTYFANGQYEQAERQAEAFLDMLPKPPSAEHEFATYILVGSKFFLGKPDEAAPLIEEFFKSYKNSKHAIPMYYFEASGLARLNSKEQAAEKLDLFLKKFSDATTNIYIPFALYDRANLHLSKQEHQLALQKIERIENEFPKATIAEAAYLLQGIAHQTLKNGGKAKESYEKALAKAKERKNASIQEEALYYLVALLGDKESAPEGADIQEALPYYSEFLNNYPDSRYKAQVVVAGFPAMVAAGKEKEALKNLQEVISQLAKQEQSPMLEAAIGSYKQYYVEAKQKANVPVLEIADQLKEDFYYFPGVDENDARTQAMLRLAVISTYQEVPKKLGDKADPEILKQNKARINVAFKELQAKYPVAKLSDRVLLSIGDYLRRYTAAPRQALPYYNEITKRSGSKEKDILHAELGIADIYAQAGNAKETNKALTLMRKIIANPKTTKETKDEAVSRLVKIYAKQGDWDAVIKEGQIYLKDFRKSRVQVQQLLATAYENKQLYGEAIKAYMQLYGTNTSNPDVAIPAMDKASQLMWDHGSGAVNGKSSKQNAYETVARFIKGSRASFEKQKLELNEKARNAWLATEKRVKKWESSGAIETLQALEAKKK